MGQIKKTMFGKVVYVNDNGRKSKAYRDIEETYNIHEGEGDYLCVNNSTGAINKDCKEIVKPNENNELVLFNNFIIVKDTSNLGKSNSVKIVNLNGNVIKTFDNISQVKNFYSVVKDGKFGLLDQDGNVLYECTHKEEITPLENNVFLVEGKRRLSPKFENGEFKCINNSKYIIEKNGKFGLLDSDLSVILDVIYDSIKVVGENIQAKLNGKLGIYDLTGNLVLDHKFETLNDEFVFSEGLCPVAENGKYGYINEKYEWVINPQFDRAFEFKRYNNGQPYAEVMDKTNKTGVKNGELNCCGLIDINGDVKLPCVYGFIDTIAENLAFVGKYYSKDEGRYSSSMNLCDIKTGKLYSQSRGSWCKPEYEDGYYKISASGNILGDYGVFDENGACVIDFYLNENENEIDKNERAAINFENLKRLETLRAEYRKKHGSQIRPNDDGGQDQGDGISVI